MENHSCTLSTDEIMSAQSSNVAPYFEKWGFFAPNFALLDNFLKRRRFSDNSETDQNLWGQLLSCPPPLATG